MDGFFGIENEHIGRLGPLEAVRFFNDLLQAEARRLSISPEIRVSERITVPDGGLDASVNNSDATMSSDFIKTGYSGFQIKTGTSFNLREPSLKKELFGTEKIIQKENLGEGVAGCLDKQGHLIFVCFGLDPVEREVNTAVKTIQGWLAQCGYQNASVYIWGQGVIKGFLGPFPSLRLKINGRGGGSVLEIFDGWQSHGDMAPEELSMGNIQRDIIEEVRTQLLTNTEAIHLRITGASGVGKTRLILEALNDERIRPLVIYTNNPTQLKSEGFLSRIGMSDSNLEIVLVLDECAFIEASDFWNRIQTLGKRIRLITIYNEEEKEMSGKMRSIFLPPLEEKEIANMLRQYDIPEEYINRWAKFCEGSPRWARMIGENIRNNAKDILSEPDNIPVVTRCIAGMDDPTSKSVRDRRLILCFLALFKRVGYKAPVAEEANAIYELIHKYDSSITRAVFDDSIRNLHDRRILQGEKTYYITPKPLQIKLWIEWWENYWSAFDMTDFAALPLSLTSGFNQMFRFAQESDIAIKTVEQLLGPEGPFTDGELLREEKGGDFFLALTEAAPDKALERLEATVSTWSKDSLQSFISGRRQVIGAIERIAVWKGLFVRAMYVLLCLAEAENDTVYTNNSTGVFKDFFSIFSPTEEAPLKRLVIIEKLISSKDVIKEQIAIKAMSLALDDHYSRIIGVEHQGLHNQPHLWNPRDNQEEAREYINKVWDLLVSSLGVVAEENKDQIVGTIVHKLQVWGRSPISSNKALKSARDIFLKGYVDKNILIEGVVHILHYGASDLPKEKLIEWGDFYNELVSNDLASLLNRYIAMNLTEDSFAVDGKYAETAKTERIIDLAKRAFENMDELLKSIQWLVTEKAGNGYSFGYHLGKQDKDKVLLTKIIDVWRNSPKKDQPNQQFIGGYLRTIQEETPKALEGLFVELSKETDILPLLPELIWRAGYTDTTIELLLSLIEEEKVDIVLMSYFKYGVEIRELKEDTMDKFVRTLIAQKKKVASAIALDIFARYYTDKDTGHKIPKDLTLEVLTDPQFFLESEGYTDTMDQYIWSEVANNFIDEFEGDKESILKIGTLMLNSIGNNGSIISHTDRYVKEVLMRISELYADEMWINVLNNLEEKGFYIFKHWLSSGELFGGGEHANSSLLEKIKLETLWDWINENVEKRAWFIAGLVPKSFSNKPGEICLAREILIHYGDREDVRRNLNANFFSEGWWGNASDHHKAELERILPYRAQETDPNVMRWLDEYIGQRKQAIENAKIREERGEF